MKKLLSILVLLITGLCLISCDKATTTTKKKTSDFSSYELNKVNYEYNYDNGVLKIDNIKNEGHVTIKENANKAYQGREIIYDSDLTQDLYLPGSFEDKVFTINIDVILGDITLNIFKDKETYSVDADFSKHIEKLKKLSIVDNSVNYSDLCDYNLDLNDSSEN